MRRILLALFVLTFSFSFAVEGMWLPQLLKQLNIEDMKAKGCKLSAEDIYSINQPSLKDAIVSFGGFCTGEIISDQGLLLTNHHCGYGAIQSHSTEEQNYLMDGFWAMDKSQELPNEGLFVRFIVRIDDVTDQVLQHVTTEMDEEVRSKTIKNAIEKIKKDNTKDTHYGAIIKPFFEGLKYYMFITETFNDVRLVGTPPDAIGKFGGDTDNWKWPRHTGDFSLFRIYADSSNNPAEYSPNNVPYKPKKYLKVNTKGIDKGDFTMVFGFPGRTDEYLPSFAIDHRLYKLNPKRIIIRESKMDILSLAMKNNMAVNIKYAAKYASLSNYYKKWKGENRGIIRFDGVNRKKKQEEQILEWINASPERKLKYGHLFTDFEKNYNQFSTLDITVNYIWEALYGVDILNNTRKVKYYIDAFQDTSISADDKTKRLERLLKSNKKFFKDYQMSIDMELFNALTNIYLKDIDAEYIPELLKEFEMKSKDNPYEFLDKIYLESPLSDPKKLENFLEDLDDKKVKSLEQDKLYQLVVQIEKIRKENVDKKLKGIRTEIQKLKRLYMEALFEYQPERSFYPNANSTMRVSYGQVDDYSPRDGVSCKHYTTLEGVIEKYNPDLDDFQLPQKLIDVYNEGDYKKYMEKGKVPVAFTSSNHTTGGNSGSPIINAKGELIGLNFDRNWEGTMSDLMYDPDQVRNISVNVKFILFIIDVYAGAGHLVDEMDLVK